MPAYNAAEYISGAIRSVEAQDFADWELIIVNDASTDDTLSFIKHYARGDARIRYVSNTENSGSARFPRLKAVSMAVSNWIFNLDADDFIAKDCLSRMIGRAESTKSDIVIGQMTLINEQGEELSYIPRYGYNMNQILTGKQACERTVGDWEIGFNCALVKAGYYRQLPNDGHYEMNMDEVDTRRLLLMASCVSLCDAVYYYRIHENSISRKASIKFFDKMHTSFELMNIISEHFSKEENVYILAVREFWRNVSNSPMFFFRHYLSFTRSEKEHIIKTMKIYYKKSLSIKPYLKMSSLKKMLLLNGYALFFFVKAVSCMITIAKEPFVNR